MQTRRPPNPLLGTQLCPLHSALPQHLCGDPVSATHPATFSPPHTMEPSSPNSPLSLTPPSNLSAHPEYLQVALGFPGLTPPRPQAATGQPSLTIASFACGHLFIETGSRCRHSAFVWLLFLSTILLRFSHVVALSIAIPSRRCVVAPCVDVPQFVHPVPGLFQF